MAKKYHIGPSEDAALTLGNMRILYSMLSAKDQLLIEVLENYQFDSHCHLFGCMESNNVQIKPFTDATTTVDVTYENKGNTIIATLTHRKIHFFRHFYRKKIMEGSYPQRN